MKNILNETEKQVENKNLREFFKNLSLVEAIKRESQKKIMETQLFKATGGKTIVFSNKCH